MTRDKAQDIVDRSMAHEPKERPWSYKVVPIDSGSIIGQCDPCQKEDRQLRKVTSGGMDAMVCTECLGDDDEWTIEVFNDLGKSVCTL